MFKLLIHQMILLTKHSSKSNLTTKDVIDFIEANKHRFKDRVYLRSEILLQLFQAWEFNRLFVTTDGEDKINGVAIVWNEGNEIEISLLLARDTESFKQQWRYFRALFNGYKLKGIRHGKVKYLDIAKLDRKLLQ